MTGALVILAALIVIGLMLFLTDKAYFSHHHHASDAELTEKEENAAQKDEKPDVTICCGQHLVCEKTSLSVIDNEIIYYDDEELDRFVGRTPESYSHEETEEFRDVLLTLLPEDVAGWARSITLRKIELPLDVRDELLLLVSELRAQS